VGQKKKQRTDEWKRQLRQRMLMMENSVEQAVKNFNRLVLRGQIRAYDKDDKVLV